MPFNPFNWKWNTFYISLCSTTNDGRHYDHIHLYFCCCCCRDAKCKRVSLSSTHQLKCCLVSARSTCLLMQSYMIRIQGRYCSRTSFTCGPSVCLGTLHDDDAARDWDATERDETIESLINTKKKDLRLRLCLGIIQPVEMGFAVSIFINWTWRGWRWLTE